MPSPWYQPWLALALAVAASGAGLPTPLALGAAPFAASLRPGGPAGGGCSAAVLGARWLLTAAHCVHGRRPASLRAAAGVARASDGPLGGTGQRRAVDRIVVHPSFKGAWAEYDIALVRLEKEFTLNKFVNVISLSDEPWGNETILCQVPGYGVIQINSSHPLDHRLKAHALNATRPCPCAAALAAEKGARLPAGWVCSAAGPHSGPCRGDSGAPLVCAGRLRAVTSATFYIHDPDTCDISRNPTTSLCADAHVLNIFIEIHPYLDWINRTIQLASQSASSVASTQLKRLTLLMPTIVTSELLRQSGKAISL